MMLDRFIKFLSILTSIFSLAFFLLLYVMHQGFDPSPYLYPKLNNSLTASSSLREHATTSLQISNASSSPLNEHASTTVAQVASTTSTHTPIKDKPVVVKKTIRTTPKTISVPVPLVVHKPVTTAVAAPSSNLSSNTPSPLTAGVLNQKAILDIVNIERAKEGLPALTFNLRLSAMAEGKAVDMINKQYFAHVSPTGVDVAHLSKVYGYEYIFLGENLAMGDFVSSSDVMTGWMNSPGHRANILSKNYTEIGISALQGDYEGRTVWYAVQEFGKPLSSCPAPDAALEATIVNEQTSVSAFEQTLTTMRAGIDQASGDQVAYNAQAENYNTMVDAYNNLVTKTKLDITTYNAGVTAFNLCLGAHVGPSTPE